MSKAKTVDELKELYHSWRRFETREICFDELTVLPVVRVPVSRLKTMRWFGTASVIYEGTLTRYEADVKAGRTDCWPPLVVEGLPCAGPVLVVDGHHRTTAAKGHGTPALLVKCVFAGEWTPVFEHPIPGSMNLKSSTAGGK